MAENPQEGIRFKEREFGIPVELCRDPDVPGEAIALYVVMRSFGPFAEAKVSSYATRLSWTDAKVRKYQKVLEKAKWIKLLREGRRYSETILASGQRPKSVKAYLCRLWWMCANKNEEVPQGVELGVTKTITPHQLRQLAHRQVTQLGQRDSQGVTKTITPQGVTKSRVPQNRNPKALKVPQALKAEREGSLENKAGGGKNTPPASSLSGSDDLKAKEILEKLNQLRAKAGLIKIADTPATREGALKTIPLYGESIFSSYEKYLSSRDRHWGPSFPLAGFISEKQVENWRASAPAGPRCNHLQAKPVAVKTPSGIFDYQQCPCGWKSPAELRPTEGGFLLMDGEKFIDAVKRKLSLGGSHA